MQTISTRYLWPLLILAALALSGCEDLNKTFTNRSGRTMTELRVTLEIKGTNGNFPTVTKWYKNRVPTITHISGDFYKLTWPVRVGPGQSYHVGAEFAESQDITYSHGGFWEPVGFARQFAGATMRHRLDADMGLVVDLSNETDLGDPVIVEALQWAVHTEHVALNNLDWTDPVLALLDWQDVTPDVPFELFPGEVRTFDVPDEALDLGTHGLVRWIATDPDGELEQLPVYELSFEGLVEALVE